MSILALPRQYLTQGLWLLLLCPPGAFAFIVLKEQTAGADHIKEELKTLVASKIAKYAVPDHILVSGRLKLAPATGNGHIKQTLTILPVVLLLSCRRTEVSGGMQGGGGQVQGSVCIERGTERQ